MVSQQSGSIVNVSSALGLVGAATSAAYCASKAAIIQLSRVVALDYGAMNIRVNALCPGSTRTPLMVEARGADGDMNYSHAPLGRTAAADEIAGAALFLASDLSTYVTGHALAVDGGWTAE
jgi:NAD(P)-dependent dehydrogenase (short-subunit alcohol dehydrogenase family)